LPVRTGESPHKPGMRIANHSFVIEIEVRGGGSLDY
jgi:hypothetical protein